MTRTILYRGAVYRKAAPMDPRHSVGAGLGPEYYIEVSADDLDPREVMQWHSGQGDPVYALGSRLSAHGRTLASEEELEALINTIERLISILPEQEDRERADNLLYDAYRLLPSVPATRPW